jgi:hypothetical protein
MSGDVRVVLEIEPEHWWLGRLDGRLVVEVTRVESYVDAAGVRWAVVEGWRHLAHGGRRWTRDLVRPAALPPELRLDGPRVAWTLPHDRHAG